MPRSNPGQLVERLFPEGFAVQADDEVEIDFDFGDLDMLVVRLGVDGQPQHVYLVG